MTAGYWGFFRRLSRSGPVQVGLILATVLVMANLSAVVDRLRHPGIPYFDAEHLLNGGVSAATGLFLIGLLFLYARRLGVLVAEGDRTIEVLENSERRYRLLTEGMRDMVWVLDPETWRFVYVSPSVEQLLGFTVDEVMARPVDGALAPEAWEAIRSLNRERAERVLTGQASPREFYTTEVEQPRRDGSTVWTEVVASYYIDEVSGKVRMLGVSRDIAERKAQEMALREAAERYENVTMSAMDAFWVADLDGRILEVNDASCEMYGYSREEMLALRIADLDVDESPEMVREHERRIVERGEDRFEARHRRKEGTILEVEVSARAWGAQGTIGSFVRDITRRKRGEEALRQSEAGLQEAQRVGRLGSWDWDARSDRITWSQEYYRIYGHDPTKPPPGYAEHLAPYTPEGAARLDAAVQKSMATGLPYELDLELARPNGAGGWVTARGEVTRDEDGNIVGLRGTAQDITDRVEAEQAVHRAAWYARSLIEAALDPLVTIGSDGAITDVNEATERVTGFSREELIGTDFSAYFSDPERARSGYQTVFNEGEVHDYALEIRHGDGSLTPVLYNASVYRDEQGAVQGVFAAARDISERRRTEEERLELERRFLQSQKLESLGVLAGGIAHDFNNILTAVLGNADLALQELSPSAAGRENLLEIVNASRRAADLCHQMLAYSGRGHFVIEPIDMGALVEDLSDLLKSTISKKAVLRLHLGEGLPPVMGDASQLGQVIMNLVINASEAIGENDGLITVSTAAVECSRAYLRTNSLADELAPGLYVSLEVVDTGCGMDEETRNRLFEPFFTTKFAGRGLGLAAVLGIVRGHKGGLRLKSEPGRGSGFKILLPAADVPVPNVPRGVSDGGALTVEGTVLLVDDEETIRVLGRRMLASLGFQVLTAVDGQEALEVYRAHQDEIVLVVLDLTMPRMDGAETLQELRRMDPEVKVIMSSGYDQQDIMPLRGEGGPVGFVQKPYTLGVLRNELQGVLAES
jgi:two-component system, cell cycle sensor histidine kinase and response regulator CckA